MKNKKCKSITNIRDGGQRMYIYTWSENVPR